MSEHFFLPLLEKKNIAKNTWSFIFDRKGLDYTFFPGQYNDITITLKNGRKDTRSFTIASSPLEKDIVMITTKAGKSDFKQSLFNLVPGDTISFRGPLGGFYLREENKVPRVFISGGIGITPFRSMIAYVVKKEIKIPMLLFASFSYSNEICFYAELLQMQKSYPLFVPVFTITDKKNKKWNGEIGRFSEALLKKYHTDITHSLYNIVGPQKMVDVTRDILVGLHVPNGRIQVENFTGYND